MNLSVKHQKLLARVVSYYQHTLSQDRRAVANLKTRWGIDKIQTLKDFGAGFSDGSLVDTLPVADPASRGEDRDTITALRQIGILDSKGRDVFSGCVIFPLQDSAGALANVYGRKISAGKGKKEFFLDDTGCGLANRRAARRSTQVILTFSVKDALILYDQGFTNAIAVCSENGLYEAEIAKSLKRVTEAHIVVTSSQFFRNKANELASQLLQAGITVFIAELPGHGVSAYFKHHTYEELKDLLENADCVVDPTRKNTESEKSPSYVKTEHGILISFENRQYDVKGIARKQTRLKVTIKAFRDAAGQAPFELATVDFYSFRSRSWFAGLCAALFNIDQQQVRRDLDAILSVIEKDEQDHKSLVIEPSEAERDEALAFLKNPDLLDEVVSDLDLLGVTGERTNKMVAYLAAVSRKLGEPLSILIQSRSSAGKSALQEAILSLVPAEDYIRYTRITDQALFYQDENALVHKILAIEEGAGLGGAAYSIRNIQSANRIVLASTGKDPGTGKLRTKEYTVNGPAAVMITTTAIRLDAETASRFIFLSIDESEQMTRAIHILQRGQETIEGLMHKSDQEKIKRKHQVAQRMLKPLRVINPYSIYLTFPSRSILSRRDHKKYLGLIRAVAFLYQYQRKIKSMESAQPFEYIEVALEDIDTANNLAEVVLCRDLSELARPSRVLLAEIRSMATQMSASQDMALEHVCFTRRMIREYTGWSDWQVKAHIKQLEDLEYLNVKRGSPGRRYYYAVYPTNTNNSNADSGLNLTSSAQIKKLIKKDEKANR